jgi:hypothetical protein
MEKGGDFAMRMASSTMLGIVLAVAVFGAGVVTDRLTNVYITNFPLDDQGNLKIATVQKTKEMLVFNQTVNVPDASIVYLTSFNTGGFKYFTITAKASKGTFYGTTVQVWFFENNFGIRTFPSGVGPITLETNIDPNHPWFANGIVGRPIEIYAATTDLYLYANPSFNGLLTIAVYLSN